jgi:acetyl esterase/lipase
MRSFNRQQSWAGRLAMRVAGARPTRRKRDFRPRLVDPLETRALLSAVLLGGGEHPKGSRIGAPESGWTEMQNVPFPTAAGESEVLDVYLPNTPVPAGGRPVMVAIHGGGWRRFNKTGYGERIASGLVGAGYIVVAPDYELSKPGAPSWPVNFEDVQAAVSWVRGEYSNLIPQILEFLTTTWKD